MLKRSTFIAFFAASFAMSAPAFADGTGKGPTYNAPAPLTAQSHTVYNHQPVSFSHGTLCHTSCGSSGPQHSNSGLPTNPRPNCNSGCNYTPSPPRYVPPHTPPPVVTPPQMRAGDTISLDGATIASMNGGVGVGVNDVFVGGGFGSGGFGSSFGTRASGAFAGRNVALSRSFSGSRGGFRGGSRGGFRGGRRGGGGKR